MDDGSWFHGSGPAYENDRSPNFVLSRGSHWSQQILVRVGVMLIADSVRCLRYLFIYLL